MKGKKEAMRRLEAIGLLRAGDLKAGDLKAGPPGLVRPTPDMRVQAVNMMRERMENAQQLYLDALSCATQPGFREIDLVILNQAQQNRLVLLWMCQTLHLVELCDEFQRIMTVGDAEAIVLRIAQNVARERSSRSPDRDTSR